MPKANILFPTFNRLGQEPLPFRAPFELKGAAEISFPRFANSKDSKGPFVIDPFSAKCHGRGWKCVFGGQGASPRPGCARWHEHANGEQPEVGHRLYAPVLEKELAPPRLDRGHFEANNPRSSEN